MLVYGGQAGEERDVEPFRITKRESKLETQLEGGEDLPVVIVVIRSQPELPLRAMSESIATQQQGLVSMPMPHVTIREREDV